jgi:DNA-binding CsgD family transcriptional regulator
MATLGTLRAADARAALGFAGEVADCRDGADLDAALARLARLVGAEAAMTSSYRPASVARLEAGDPSIFTPELLAAVGANAADHPVARSDFRAPQSGARRLSDFVSPRAWRKAGLFNDFYRCLGMSHEVSAQISWGSAGLSRCVTVHRGGSDFGAREMALLEVVAPHLRAAQARVDAAALATRRLALLARDSRRGGEGTLVLGSGNGITAASPRAAELLLRWFGSGTEELPPQLARWRLEARAGAAPLSFQRRRDESTLEARLLPAGGEELLLLSERAGTISPAALAQALPITPRQAEVLSRLAGGATNDGIALALGISRHTVIRHVEGLYLRLGVQTRAAATKVALETVAAL